jgi:hypothetical protein
MRLEFRAPDHKDEEAWTINTPVETMSAKADSALFLIKNTVNLAETAMMLSRGWRTTVLLPIYLQPMRQNSWSELVDSSEMKAAILWIGTGYI